MNNNINFFFLLSVLANITQLANYDMNVMDATNNEILNKLQEQNKKYLEKIIEQNEEIIKRLSN